MRARRSCLSVPATQQRFVAKADASDADEVLLDLEDSVAAASKAEARGMAIDALRRYDFKGKLRAVRINGIDSAWCYDDVISVVEQAGDRIDCLIVPKVEDAGEVHFFDHLLSQIEAKVGLKRTIGLELQIESAKGLDNVSAIAAASTRTEALIFGPGDLSASLRLPELTVGGLKPDYPGDFWHYFMARIVVAARAHGLQAIDGPYGRVRDVEGLRTFSARAATLGYDGKWALGPTQIATINAAFTPAQVDFDKASAILDAYRMATEEHRVGAVMLGDEMIDEASRKMALVMVERGQAAGMTVRPWSPSPGSAPLT
jgi:citrate lyase subunit beta / citryl-CoA lyase